MGVSLWEVMERANNGPEMSPDDFNMKIFRTCQKLLEKYDVQYDEDVIIPCDDELARNVFEAGLDLFVEVGVYHSDKKKVIKFSREEVLEELADLPSETVSYTHLTLPTIYSV